MATQACIAGAEGGLGCTSGLYAERAAVDARLLTVLPKSVGLEEAAAVPVSYFTAYVARVLGWPNRGVCCVAWCLALVSSTTLPGCTHGGAIL